MALLAFYRLTFHWLDRLPTGEAELTVVVVVIAFMGLLPVAIHFATRRKPRA
jgi:hypothetical protein